MRSFVIGLILLFAVFTFVGALGQSQGQEVQAAASRAEVGLSADTSQ